MDSSIADDHIEKLDLDIEFQGNGQLTKIINAVWSSPLLLFIFTLSISRAVVLG